MNSEEIINLYTLEFNFLKDQHATNHIANLTKRFSSISDLATIGCSGETIICG